MLQMVYIVDDDASICKSLKRLIRSAGMEARTFRTSEEFLGIEKIDQEACMIVDIMMPDMNGLDLKNEIRAQGFDLPVIFITGFDTPKIRNEAKQSGAVGYFKKPVDAQALLDSIQWALSNK